VNSLRVLNPVASLSLVALCVALAGGCAKEPAPTDPAVALVLEVSGQSARGEWDAVWERVDMDAKGARMLGEIYQNGSESAKQTYKEAMRKAFRETWERYWANAFRDRLLWVQLDWEAEGPATAVVMRAPGKPGTDALSWTWTVEPDASGRLRITDREVALRGNPPAADGFVRYALGKIESRVGRPPTLDDWNVHIDDLVGSTRVRQFKVELPDK
jgi:hypothetical protein